MTLIKSISGIRGTIGGQVGDNLTPVDAVKFAAAYGTWLINRNPKQNIKVVNFDKENIDLNFIKVNDIKYNHSNSHLSIIDVIMHNSRSELNDLLNQFSMIKP